MRQFYTEYKDNTIHQASVGEISWFKSSILSIALIFIFGNSYSQETVDNKIYQKGKEFYFSYIYIDTNGEGFYFDKLTPPTWTHASDMLYLSWLDTVQIWKFVAKQDVSDTTIVGIKLTYNSSSYIRGQTPMKYQYIMQNGLVCYEHSASLTENEREIEIRTPYQYLFKILTLNPLPHIKKTYKKGRIWHESSATLGGSDWKMWKNEEWGEWLCKHKIPIYTDCYYRILRKNVIIPTCFGILRCYKITSIGKSSLGDTYLIAYFNEKYGFVLLKYINIDNSMIVLQLKNF